MQNKKKLSIVCRAKDFDLARQRYKLWIDSGLYDVELVDVDKIKNGIEITFCSLDEASFIDRQLGRRIEQATQNKKRGQRQRQEGEYANKKPRAYSFSRGLPPLDK